MAPFHGNSGVVKIGANAIAEVRSFSATETIDTVHGSEPCWMTRSGKTMQVRVTVMTQSTMFL